ncbi:MAG TPA: RHS repeat-associated core domain-containing protein, partial [Puia sp.]|nr:RHS repeat-associated core domain-containing protein [Puia sp.]
IQKLNNTLLYNYQYYQLNRLVQMDAWNRTGTGWNNITKVADFRENVKYDPNGNILGYRRNGNNTFAGQPLEMDSLNYIYTPGTNRLDHIADSVPSGNYSTDIDNQTAGNFKYDSIGELIADNASNITNITWTSYGKISTITKGDGTTTSFTYDPNGYRISKKVTAGGNTITTWYARDIEGNVLSIYTYGDPSVRGADLTQTELHIYGIQRLGIQKMNRDVQNLAGSSSFPMPLLKSGDSLSFTRGNKLFELSNHVGNILSVISDKRYGISTDDSTVNYFIPDVVNANDYYPFGSLQPGRLYLQNGAGTYRYGFNGKERDNEIKGVGDQIDYGMRVYDPRAGRFLSVDPFASQYPWYTPYQFAGNTPIQAFDLDGLEPKTPGKRTGETKDAPVQGSRDKTVRSWKWNGTKWIDNSSLQEATVTAYSKHFHRPLTPFLKSYYEDQNWDATLDIGKDLLDFLFLEELKKKVEAFGPPSVGKSLEEALKKKAPELYDAAEKLVKEREDGMNLAREGAAQLVQELAGEEKVADALKLLYKTLQQEGLTPIIYDINLTIVSNLDAQLNNYRGFDELFKGNYKMVKKDHLHVMALTYKQFCTMMQDKFIVIDDFKTQQTLVGADLNDPTFQKLFFGGEKPAFYIYYNDVGGKGFLHLDEVGILPIIQQ